MKVSLSLVASVLLNGSAKESSKVFVQAQFTADDCLFVACQDFVGPMVSCPLGDLQCGAACSDELLALDTMDGFVALADCIAGDDACAASCGTIASDLTTCVDANRAECEANDVSTPAPSPPPVGEIAPVMTPVASPVAAAPQAPPTTPNVSEGVLVACILTACGNDFIGVSTCAVTGGEDCQACLSTELNDLSGLDAYTACFQNSCQNCPSADLLAACIDTERDECLNPTAPVATPTAPVMAPVMAPVVVPSPVAAPVSNPVEVCVAARCSTTLIGITACAVQPACQVCGSAATSSQAELQTLLNCFESTADCNCPTSATALDCIDSATDCCENGGDACDGGFFGGGGGFGGGEDDDLNFDVDICDGDEISPTYLDLIFSFSASGAIEDDTVITVQEECRDELEDFYGCIFCKQEGCVETCLDDDADAIDDPTCGDIDDAVDELKDCCSQCKSEIDAYARCFKREGGCDGAYSIALFGSSAAALIGSMMMGLMAFIL